MSAYIIRRLLLIIPTLLGIMILNFAIIQAAPGGPVENMIAQIKGFDTGAGTQIGGSDTADTVSNNTDTSQGVEQSSVYQGARGLPTEVIKEIETLYGFDRPAHERFFMMLKNYATFEFGDSHFRDRSVIELIVGKNAGVD